MAEVAGLVLGAAGVAVLVGVFKDCVDLFSLISAAQSLGRDYELLEVKLDVEKTLFLQWAERVRLLNYRELGGERVDYMYDKLVDYIYDKRLDDRSTGIAVTKILQSVQALLSESESLTQRYGLTQAKNQSSVNPAMSGPRMARFLQDFDRLTLGPLKERRRTQTSHMKKVYWVVHDKDKFDALIKNLSYFISKLNDVIPDMQATSMSMTKADLEPLSSLRQLTLVLDASAAYASPVAELARQAVRELCQKRILRRLWYRVMDDRRDSVADAHYKTLRWALEPPDPDSERADLGEWFRLGSGVFWLSGKPGSGKSTLVKYLYRHPKTKSFLQKWAKEYALTLASFFLWNLGTEEQKSQEGLLRALLYQVLDSEPALAEDLLPKMWYEAYQGDDVKLGLPSKAEMTQAFQELGRLCTTTRKFCFFIDGIDEYSGNYMDGIAFINSLAANSNVKVLVSSRPIAPCEDAFAAKPMLRLQDLTRDDILAYIDETIGSHPYLTILEEEEPGSASQIKTEVADKSSGVFLWVVLACRSLLEGYAAFDSASELKRRVDELPPELEALFQHILGKIEGRYQAQAARMLRVCYQAQLVQGTSTNKIYTVGLALVGGIEMDVANVSPIRITTTDKEKRTKCHLLQGRLRSRCCGLVELVSISQKHDPDRCFCLSTGQHDRLIDSTVEFMHRTLFEFLSIRGVWELPCLQFQDSSFDANAILACTSLQLIQLSLVWPAINSNRPEVFVKDCLVYTIQSEKSSIRVVGPILKKMEEALPAQLPVTSSSVPPFFSKLKISSPHYFLAAHRLGLVLAVEAGMVDFIRSYGASHNLCEPIANEGAPLLFHATHRPYLSSLPFGETSGAMVDLLLSMGCDPNEEFVDEHRSRVTTWLRWLEKISCHQDCDSLAREITRRFMQAGADIDLPTRILDEPLGERISLYLEQPNTRHAKALQRVIKRWKLELIKLANSHVRGLPEMCGPVATGRDSTKRARPEEDLEPSQQAKCQKAGCTSND